MSQGKYSPSLTREMCNRPYDAYCYNADKQIPPPFTPGSGEYETRIHFDNYDEEGYDDYGYSAFDANGNYVGIRTDGVDRWGYSEWDYLAMDDDEFENICIYGG